jgi:quercetin dioxygenase-like cupin family protein
MTKTAKRAKTAGAYKAGHGGRHVFDLYSLKRVDAGGKTGTVDHYADTRAAVIEGERMQVGLAFEKAGCGARPHTHPNEQFNFVVKGTLMADIAGRKTMKVPAGSVVYFPANVVHRTYATPDEDVIFYVVKDLSHGIAGRPVKRVEAGGAHYVRAEQERQTATRRSGPARSATSRRTRKKDRLLVRSKSTR